MNLRILALLILFALTLGLAGCTKSSDAGKAASTDLAGQWNGTLEVNQLKLRLVLKVTRAADGMLSATMDSPDQGAKNLPVTSLLFNHPALKLEMDGIGAAYNATLSKDGNELAGTWEQGQAKFQLALRRAKASEVAAQEPKLSYALSPGATPDIRGYWKATLDVQGTKLRLGLKIGKAPNGKFNGTLDSLDQGARDIPITAVNFKSPDAKLEWKMIGATFTGTLNKDGTRLTGNWEQMGRPMPITFERTDQPFTASAATGADLSFTPTPGVSDIHGYWLGTLEIGQANLRLALKIGKATDGNYSGGMDSIDQGAKDVPMTSITFTNPAVHLEWRALGAKFDGKLNPDGTEMSGTFNQGPVKNVPLTFARTESPAK